MQEDFDKMYKGNKPFFEKINGENIEVLEHLIVCLIGEIGEFSNIVKKISRGDFSYEQKSNELHEELTDTFIYLIKIINQCDIDMEYHYQKKLQKNRERFLKYKVNEDI